MRAFRAAGEQCVVLDDLSAGVRSRVPSDVPFMQADVLDADALDRLFAEYAIEGVVHLAGKKSVPESVLRPDLYERINTDGTQSLLNACLRHHVRHVVFSSTAAVYGVIASDAPVPETAQVAPINPYGETKLAAEHAIEKATTAGELDAIAFRYFNVGGAAAPELEDLYGENLIPILRRAIASGTPVQVFGTELPTRDGTCIRDYIHVADLADAHLAAALYLREHPRQAFEVINLGTGTGSTVLEVIAAVAEAEGMSVPWQAAEARIGDPVASTCDASLAATVLSWHPTRALQAIATRAQ